MNKDSVKATSNFKKMANVFKMRRSFDIERVVTYFFQSYQFKYVIIGLTVVMILICLGKTIIFWLSYNSESELTSPIISKVQPKKLTLEGISSSKTVLNYNAVVKRNLFGGQPYEVGTLENQGEKTPENIPLTRLKLKLVGTIVDKENKFSRAIIEDPATGKQSLYHVGEKVKNGCIKKIAPFYVIISTIKGDEVLVMDVEDSKKESIFDSHKGKAETTLVSKKLFGMASNNMDGMDDVIKDVIIRPYFRRGKILGFKITQIKPGSVFHKLGLKNGDILLSINDEKLDDPEKLLYVYDYLKNFNEITLKVQRHGKQKIINYHVN